MFQALSDKKELFRKDIRRQKNEQIFKQKRITQNKTTFQNSINYTYNFDVIKQKLQTNQCLVQDLEEYSELENPFNLFKDIFLYISNSQSLQIIQSGLKCLNNLIYFSSDLQGLNLEFYQYLKLIWHIDNYLLKKTILNCIGNFIYDQKEKDYAISIQNDFFIPELIPQFFEEYSFIINILCQFFQFCDLIKAIQFLAEIIKSYPDDGAFSSLQFIFDNCTTLEACELVETNYPISKFLKSAEINDQAYKASLSLLYRVNISTKVDLYNRGYKQLLKYLLNNENQRYKGFEIMNAFIQQPDGDFEVFLLIDAIYQLFEDNKIYHLLLNECNSQKMTIICNSIMYGNIYIFIEFLNLNIIERVFIPYLCQNDILIITIILETITYVLQREELTENQLQFIMNAFINQQFETILIKIQELNLGDHQQEIYQYIDTICELLK